MPIEDDEQELPKNPNPNPNLSTPRRRRSSLPELWFKLQNLQHHPQSPKTIRVGDGDYDETDQFSLLSDETLTMILGKVPISQHASNALVCKRWLAIQGRLVRSISVIDWGFLESGRLMSRFPKLTEVNLVRACFFSSWNSGILLSHKLLSIHIESDFVGDDGFVLERALLGSNSVDRGLKLLASSCPNLRKLVLVNASEVGLGLVAEECVTLQELEMHCCDDKSLKGISGFKNLQILKLVGSVDGLYSSVVTDIGLTILAQGCKRLVRLELSGCEGSYDGIKAIGQCCFMLEELTIVDHRMDGGWLSALSYCGNLKTLKLQSCSNTDSSPGPEEHLGSCPTLEELYLERCHVRVKPSMKALFLVCESVREITLQDCWGLEDDVFHFAAICRRVRSLTLEGCSLLTTKGLDSVIHSWKELQMLSVVSCNNVKDIEITASLATLFSVLKELKWRPNSRSLLASSLAGTGVGKKGGRFFKRV